MATKPKLALVTGAGGGIGRAAALALLDAGYHVACGYNANRAGAQTLQDAFAATARDPQFMEVADKRNLNLSLVTGKEAQQILTKVFSTPRRITERARDIIK